MEKPHEDQEEDEANEGEQQEGEDDLFSDNEEEQDDDDELEHVKGPPKLPSFHSVTLIDRLNLLQEKRKPVNHHRRLDERRQRIREDIKEKFKNAPKTVLQKAEEKKSTIERQLESTDNRLGELLAYGDELVSNIKVANERRELQRRTNENELRGLLEQDLQGESVLAMASFDDIMARWSELETYKEPVALYEELEQQKQRIGDLMRSKDDIIAQCQREVDRVNAQYYADQEQQASDICCLVERIDAQVELIKKAYRSHIELLQQTIEEERETIQLEATNRWNEFYDNMITNEEHKFAVVKEKETFYASEIARISAKQEEITRATRIRLEKDAELLEWELRNVKNNVLMNSEKLDYNYQVLQKRNEENVLINNQQKRRVARLNETISALKHKIATTRHRSVIEKRKLTSDIQKLHASITELEKKAVQFRRTNLKKFNKVWAINYKEVRASLRKIFEIDRILHEQQLILPWAMPDVDLDDINPVPELEDDDSDGDDNNQSVEGTQQAFMSSKKGTAMTKKKSKKPRASTASPSSALESVDIRLLRNILRKIADRAGFLVEERLMNILEPYTEQEQRVVRIDNIFNALRISNIETVASLVKYFEKYAWCPNCSTGISADAVRSMYTIGEDLEDCAPAPTRQTLATQELLRLHKGEEATKGKATTATQKQKKSCKNHYLVIEPALVLTSLNDFTRKHWQHAHSTVNTTMLATTGSHLTLNETQMNLKTVNSIKVSNEEILNFWRKFETFIPPEKQKLWKTLEHGLNHYLEVLKERSQLDSECSFLRRQNNELRHLLQKFQI